MSVKVIVKITKNKEGADFYIDIKNWFPQKVEHDAAVWLCKAINGTLVAIRDKTFKQ
jgi:hypothetical protein